MPLILISRQHPLHPRWRRGGSPWLMAGAVGLLALMVLLALRMGSRKPLAAVAAGEAAPEVTAADADDQLIGRICHYMDSEQPYLRSDLKLTDVASALGVNRNALSSCINSKRGCSFSQFVNAYRIGHAKQLLATRPGMKMVELSISSGFTNETSFFRSFKAITGMTPTEWKAQAERKAP